LSGWYNFYRGVQENIVMGKAQTFVYKNILEYCQSKIIKVSVPIRGSGKHELFQNK
jgi:hypothetical protein